MQKNQGIPSKQKFVPFLTTEGIQASIKQSDIPQEKWTHYHGETATGKQVNSMQMQEIGKSLLIQGNTGPTLSVTMDEAEVGFTKYLRQKGFTVTAPGK